MNKRRILALLLTVAMLLMNFGATLTAFAEDSESTEIVEQKKADDGAKKTAEKKADDEAKKKAAEEAKKKAAEEAEKKAAEEAEKKAAEEAEKKAAEEAEKKAAEEAEKKAAEEAEKKAAEEAEKKAAEEAEKKAAEEAARNEEKTAAETGEEQPAQSDEAEKQESAEPKAESEEKTEEATEVVSEDKADESEPEAEDAPEAADEEPSQAEDAGEAAEEEETAEEQPEAAGEETAEEEAAEEEAAEEETAEEETEAEEVAEEEEAAEYAVTFRVGEGAVVTANGAKVSDGATVVCEGELSFDVDVAEGYVLDKVEASGAKLSGKYRLTDISGDGAKVTVTAALRPEVRFEAGEGLKITANGADVTNGSAVAEGGALDFAVTAEAGYEIENVTAEGAKLSGEGGSYSLANVSGEGAKVTAVAVLRPEVRFEANEGARITANGADATNGSAVAEGGALDFAVAAEAGYEIENVTAEGAKLSGEGGSYSLANVSGEGAKVVVTAALTMPAGRLVGSANGITILATFPENTFPYGVEMKVSGLGDGMSSGAKAVAERYAQRTSDDDGEKYVADGVGVDVTFRGPDGKGGVAELEPANGNSVSIRAYLSGSGLDRDAEEYVVVHDPDGAVAQVVDVVENLTTASFEMDSFSPIYVYEIGINKEEEDKKFTLPIVIYDYPADYIFFQYPDEFGVNNSTPWGDKDEIGTLVADKLDENGNLVYTSDAVELYAHTMQKIMLSGQVNASGAWEVLYRTIRDLVTSVPEGAKPGKESPAYIVGGDGFDDSKWTASGGTSEHVGDGLKSPKGTALTLDVNDEDNVVGNQWYSLKWWQDADSGVEIKYTLTARYKDADGTWKTVQQLYNLSDESREASGSGWQTFNFFLPDGAQDIEITWQNDSTGGNESSRLAAPKLIQAGNIRLGDYQDTVNRDPQGVAECSTCMDYCYYVMKHMFTDNDLNVETGFFD